MRSCLHDSQGTQGTDPSGDVPSLTRPSQSCAYRGGAPQGRAQGHLWIRPGLMSGSSPADKRSRSRNMAKRRAAVVPDRRWSADVILPATDSKPEVRYTSVIYGSNPSEAETRKVAEL